MRPFRWTLLESNSLAAGAISLPGSGHFPGENALWNIGKQQRNCHYRYQVLNLLVNYTNLLINYLSSTKY